MDLFVITKMRDGYECAWAGCRAFVFVHPSVPEDVFRDAWFFCGGADLTAGKAGFERTRKRVGRVFDLCFGGVLPDSCKHPDGRGVTVEHIGVYAGSPVTLRRRIGIEVNKAAPTGQELDASTFNQVPDWMLAWTHFELCDLIASESAVVNPWTVGHVAINVREHQVVVVRRLLEKARDRFDLFGPK
jgi:hypothetical protein